MNAGFTLIIITADNKQQIVRQYLLEFVRRFYRKRPWFRPISLAMGLFPLNPFRKQNNSIPNSLLKQFFQVSFNLWLYFARKYKLKATDCILTMPNFTLLLCLFTKLKSWDSPDCPSHQIPLISPLWLLPIRLLEEKNSKKWISDAKMGWYLRWQRFWAKSWFGWSQKYLTNGSRDYTGALQILGSVSK
jgi:hypothetical protein